VAHLGVNLAVPYVPNGFTPAQWKKRHEKDIEEAHAVQDTHHLMEDVDLTAIHFVKKEDAQKDQEVGLTELKGLPRQRNHRFASELNP